MNKTVKEVGNPNLSGKEQLKRLLKATPNPFQPKKWYAFKLQVHHKRSVKGYIQLPQQSNHCVRIAVHESPYTQHEHFFDNPRFGNRLFAIYRVQKNLELKEEGFLYKEDIQASLGDIEITVHLDDTIEHRSLLFDDLEEHLNFEDTSVGIYAYHDDSPEETIEALAEAEITATHRDGKYYFVCDNRKYYTQYITEIGFQIYIDHNQNAL